MSWNRGNTNFVLSETSNHKRKENKSHWLGKISHKREQRNKWQRTSPAWSGTIANTSNCAMAIEGLFFKNRLTLPQIKQTCQLEKRIYPSRYIKRNDTNWATRPMPQAGIAAPEIWISNRALPARRMFMLNHKNLIIFLLKVIKFDSEIWSFFCLIVKFDSNLLNLKVWPCRRHRQNW